MFNPFANISSSIAGEGVDLILLFGLIVLLGSFGARLFQRFHIPQVVGYVTVGIILGPCLKLISQQTLQTLEPFSLFTLGIIGFLIGGELKKDIFVRFGRQVAEILLFEGGTAYLFVVLLSFIPLGYFYEWSTAAAVATVFGAICSATDPASTINVLWEYKARGPLTTMLTTIVALDDALALILYITSVGIAGILTGHKEVGLLTTVVHSLYEIVGSLGLGATTGLILLWMVRRTENEEKMLVLVVGTVVLAIGSARSLGLDIILSSMAMGVTFVNLSPRQSTKSFELTRRFSPPLYIMFFVLIGAELNITLTGKIWLLAAVYIIGSVIGKTTGSYLGAVHCRAVPSIRKYLGLCLYQQGTIAIALLIMASHRFEGQIRDMMLSVIITGVFVLQLVGPLFVKYGIKKAGEAGLNITEDDLIGTYKVADVMDTKVPVISAGTSLGEVIRVVSNTENFYYPVVDSDKKLVGAVTLDGIRNTFSTQELNSWLVALDIAEPIITKITPDMALSDAFEKAKQLDLEHLSVVLSGEDDKFAGVLSCRGARRLLSAEVLSRQQKADSMHSIQSA